MNYPKHVAIIPDGNRTWATENGFIKMAGHLEWFKRMIEIAEHVFTKNFYWCFDCMVTKYRKFEK